MDDDERMSTPPNWPPPWPITGEWDEDRECSRCGEIIPARWRHFWRPCVCTYTPTDRPPHLADPACDLCAGTGYRPCEPQDLSIVRHSGACATCGLWSSVLIHYADGIIPGSAHHELVNDEDIVEEDHEVVVVGAPLVRAVTETLDRAHRRDAT